MPTQTLTRAVESDSEPTEIYKVLAKACNIPKWAPAFADFIERIDDTHCRVTKNNATFSLELVLHPSAGTVDYIREMPQQQTRRRLHPGNTSSAGRKHHDHDRVNRSQRE
jgi:hypothetical protein